ncbi:hypothetical protein, partial [Streptosporangium roseum]|uniref:hypothetical protein n=1 Tax=Streptosporangium roseum TaxID=2001 RepID=UPI00332EB6E2
SHGPGSWHTLYLTRAQNTTDRLWRDLREDHTWKPPRRRPAGPPRCGAAVRRPRTGRACRPPGSLMPPRLGARRR